MLCCFLKCADVQWGTRLWRKVFGNSSWFFSGHKRGYSKLKCCMKTSFIALAGNRTRVNCLEGSYASHYTTNACFAVFWSVQMFNEGQVMKESVWQLFIIFLDTHQFPNLHEPWPVNFCPLLVLLGHMIDTLKWWVTLLHWPGIEPGSTAWEAAMLSTIPPMHVKTV